MKRDILLENAQMVFFAPTSSNLQGFGFSNYKKLSIAFSLLLTLNLGGLFTPTTLAQSGMVVNTTGFDPDPSAILDVQSTTQGFLAPRMSEAERTAIATPATGLLVYQTNNSAGYYYFDGANWQLIGSASSVAMTTSGRVPYWNGSSLVDGAIFQDGSGVVGIGTSSPGSGTNSRKLFVNGGSLIVVSPESGVGRYADSPNIGTMNLRSTNAPASGNAGASIVFEGSYTGGSSMNFAYIRALKEVSADDGDTAAFLAFGTKGSGNTQGERMRITSNGRVAIGTSSPNSARMFTVESSLGGNTDVAYFKEASVSGYLSVIAYSNINRTALLFTNPFRTLWFDDSGNLRTHSASPTTHTSGTVVGTQTSTRSTKQDITDFSNTKWALQKVLESPLHRFRYINEVKGYGEDSKNRLGFIADEVDPIFMNGNAIDQVSVNGLLMAAIKEQQAQIEALKAELSSEKERSGSLEASVESLEQRLKRLEELLTK